MNRIPIRFGRNSLVAAFLRSGVISQLPAIQYNGAVIDGAALGGYLAAVAFAALPASGICTLSTVANVSTTALTLNATNCVNGIVNASVVMSGGSANTNTTDTATAIIATYWPNAFVGATSLMNIVNLNSGTMTLAGGTGVTLSGTATAVTAAMVNWQLKITNLANPALTGAVATNTTTTTAAVAVNNTQATPTTVIPVAASTGMIANASYLRWVNADGTTASALVTAINTLNITVNGNLSKAIPSGSAVSVFNNAITATRMYSTVTAIMAA